MRCYSLKDRWIARADIFLNGIVGVIKPRTQKMSPAELAEPVVLSEAERQEVIAMMRINHTGEVCAQALYTGQALGAEPSPLQRLLREAGREEEDHLQWTSDRLTALKGQTSLLNPLWYAGALSIGFLAAKCGEAYSLGFLKETEEQVEAHLARHLEALPQQDQQSIRVLAQMKEDEMKHAQLAQANGAVDLPFPIKVMMKGASRVMTAVAKHI